MTDARQGPGPDPAPLWPARIQLSDTAEEYLDRLGVALEAGEVGYHQLPPSLRQLHTFAFEAGRKSLLSALEQANADADRLYAEVCRRTPRKGDWTDFGELSRRRGEQDRAARHDARIASMFHPQNRRIA